MCARRLQYRTSQINQESGHLILNSEHIIKNCVVFFFEWFGFRIIFFSVVKIFWILPCIECGMYVAGFYIEIVVDNAMVVVTYSSVLVKGTLTKWFRFIRQDASFSTYSRANNARSLITNNQRWLQTSYFFIMNTWKQ